MARVSTMQQRRGHAASTVSSLASRTVMELPSQTKSSPSQPSIQITAKQQVAEDIAEGRPQAGRPAQKAVGDDFGNDESRGDQRHDGPGLETEIARRIGAGERGQQEPAKISGTYIDGKLARRRRAQRVWR